MRRSRFLRLQKFPCFIVDAHLHFVDSHKESDLHFFHLKKYFSPLCCRLSKLRNSWFGFKSSWRHFQPDSNKTKRETAHESCRWWMGMMRHCVFMVIEGGSSAAPVNVGLCGQAGDAHHSYGKVR